MAICTYVQNKKSTFKLKKIVRSVTVSQSIEFYKDIISPLQEAGYAVISLSSPGPELSQIRELGAKVIEVPMERHIALFSDIKSLIWIIRIFKAEKPYAVHSMTPKAGLLCMMAAWLCGVPRRVHTFTGLVWPTAAGLKRRLLMVTDWLTCACATHIIPEGKGVMDDLRKVTKKPMKVLGYGNVQGVDMQRFSRRPEIVKAAEYIAMSDVFTFLFVGRIVGDKGINELVEAFTKLLRQKYAVRLILVGSFEESLDPISEESKCAIENMKEIQYVGPKLDDELIAYYAASDCFVFPSYREGFPNTVLEAGAMGLPCIVTDINGSREIIENGKNGIIIPSKDTDALYAAMEGMMANKKEASEMAGNARPMIESRFERGFVRQCLLDFYEEIM